MPDQAWGDGGAGRDGEGIGAGGGAVVRVAAKENGDQRVVLAGGVGRGGDEGDFDRRLTVRLEGDGLGSALGIEGAGDSGAVQRGGESDRHVFGFGFRGGVADDDGFGAGLAGEDFAGGDRFELHRQRRREQLAALQRFDHRDTMRAARRQRTAAVIQLAHYEIPLARTFEVHCRRHRRHYQAE